MTEENNLHEEDKQRLKDSINILKNDLNSIYSKYIETGKANSNFSQIMQKQEEALENLKEAKSNLESEVNFKTQEIAELKGKLSAFFEDNSKLFREIEESKNVITELFNQNNFLNNELNFQKANYLALDPNNVQVDYINKILSYNKSLISKSLEDLENVKLEKFNSS